jgi:hypothetical protein
MGRSVCPAAYPGIFLYDEMRNLLILSIRSDSKKKYQLELSLALPLALLRFNTFQGPASKLKPRPLFASTKSKFGCHPSQVRLSTLFKTAILLQRFTEVLFQ